MLSPVCKRRCVMLSEAHSRCLILVCWTAPWMKGVGLQVVRLLCIPDICIPRGSESSISPRCVHVCVLVAQSCLTLWDPMDRSPPGVGCHSLLKGIFPTQGLNPGLPALQADSLPSELPGKPKCVPCRSRRKARTLDSLESRNMY